MQEKNWTKLFQEHKGKWVALKDDEQTVIASGRDAHQVVRKAVNEGYENPILFKVPKEHMAYIGTS